MRTATPPMPKQNFWLTDSVYPISHMNPAATDSVTIAGPVGGKKLSREEVRIVPNLLVSNPTVKKIGMDSVVFASGTFGVQKILATGKSFELISFLAYPGMEDLAAKSEDLALQALLQDIDDAKRKKDAERLSSATEILIKLGLNHETGINGVYNLIDKDGCHYCVYGGVNILKSTDGNQVRGALKIVQALNLIRAMPSKDAKHVTRLIGLSMTYDGYLVAVAPHALVVLDRDLAIQSIFPMDDDKISNSVAIDERNGIYVVTSRRMLKLVWNGTVLSNDPKEGAWESEYSSMSEEKSRAMGAFSRGSGTTPALMGFNDDPDKLVVIADSDERIANLVAFWRDEIPADFKLRIGAKSRRIADQIRIDISRLSVQSAPTVLGYGVAVLNSTYPYHAKIPRFANTWTSGVTQPAPRGVQKFIWNPNNHRFENGWTNPEIDNTDWMVPSVSSVTNEMYVAHKENGDYQFVGLDWKTGEIKDRWLFPDDSRVWNSYGGITTILENGDLMIGGIFGAKRLCIGRSPLH